MQLQDTRRCGLISSVVILVLALAAPASAETGELGGLEWPFPEFTRADKVKPKVESENGDLYAKAVGTWRYAVVVLPLEEVRGSVDDIATVVVSGSGPREFKETRRTENRVYANRGTQFAAWISVDLRDFPADVVVELDATNSRLLAYYRIDVTFGAVNPATWKNVYREALMWKMAAEGR